MKLLFKLCLLACLVKVCPNLCEADAPQNETGSGFSDAELRAIQQGYEQRVEDLISSQKVKPFRDYRASGWNAVQRFAYPRIEFAAVSLWCKQNVDEANQAMMEYGDYFLKNPANVLHRDNFHWHSEMALRLIELFGQSGSRTPGLLKPSTEDKILEAVWLYCKRRQEDQMRNNTKAEADTEASHTWRIYESENHHSQSCCTQWHFAKLVHDRPGFKDRKYDDRRTAREHLESWNEYLKVYFLERAKKGIFIEMMSRDYNHKSLKGIFNIYDFATNQELKRKAGLYLNLYFTYWGQEQFNGIAGGGKSRLYQDLAPGTSEYGWLFFGVGKKPRLDSTILSAMTTGYRPPLVVVDIVCDRAGRGVYEIMQRPLGLAEAGHYEPPVYHMRTDVGGIARYSYCTPDFIMGTAMVEARPKSDWALISSQNRSHGVIFPGDAAAAILPQCVKTLNDRAYNTQWSVQKKGTLICQKLKSSTGAGQMRVWFAGGDLSKPTEENGWVFAESKGAYAAVRIVEGGHHWETTDSPAKGEWLCCDNEYSPVILEVVQKAKYTSFEQFRAEVIDGAFSFAANILNYTGVYGDSFTLVADYSKPPLINGRPVNYAPAKAYDSPFLTSGWNSGVVYVQKGNRHLILDFNESQ